MTRTTMTVVALAAMALGAPSASASTGAITRAHADPAWTVGSIAGSVAWTDCDHAGCRWVPYATVQPATPDYRCLGDEWLDNDPNTRQVWSGGQFTANGITSFDMANASVLTGVYGQRLCLMAIRTDHKPHPVCLAQQQTFPGLECPPVDQFFGVVLASSFLVVPPPVTAPAPPAGGGDVAAPKPIRLTDSTAARAAKLSLAKRFGKRWRKGSNRKVSCSRKSAARFRCKAAWRYDGRARKATVVVTKTAAGVKVKLL